MSSSFNEHYERACQAQSNREQAAAFAAFEVALTVAEAPHERALALNGLADIYFVKKQDERAFDLMDQAIAACLPRPDAETPSDARVAYPLAQVWYDKGTFLVMRNRDAEALEVLDESLHRFLDHATAVVPRDDNSLNLQRVVVETLSMKGSTLLSLERLKDAFDCYEDLINRFQGVEDTRIQKRVARSLGHRAWCFGKFGRQDKEIAGYDALVERFGVSRDPDITEIVLDALERKMQIYRDQEDLATVIEICDDIRRRYGRDTHWQTANTVARTMIRQAVALGKRGDHGKELANYDAVVRQFGDSSERLLRRHAAKALMFKAVTLNDADQSAAEIDCYDEVIRRYGEDPDNEVRVVAADALVHKGFGLGAIAEDAAQDTGVREIDAEIACYDAVLSRYGEEKFIGLRRAVAEALLHKSETLMEVGRTGEAIPCLDSLIASYALIEDADIQEVVKDARALKAQL